MSTLDTGGTLNYTYTLSAPIVTTQTNYTFYYIVALSNSTGTYYISTTTSNQTVNPFAIDNCTLNSNVLFNMTMIDEETLTGINGTIEALVYIYAQNTRNQVAVFNKSFNYTGLNTARICINTTGTYSMDYTIKHFGNESLYFKKFRNIQNLTITSTNFSQNLTLYNLLISSGYAFRITSTGTNLNNLVISVYKQYLPSANFILVESPLSNSDKEAIAHLIPQSAVYNFVISSAGTVLGSFNNYQVTCQNPSIGQCYIILNLVGDVQPTVNFNNYLGVSVTNYLNNSNGVLTTVFSSTDSKSHTITQLLIKNSGFSNETICNNSLSAESGTIICSIPNAFQNSSYILKTFVDGSLRGSGVFTQGEDPEWYGADILIELFMFTSIVLLMTAHPVLIVIGAMLGLILSVALIFMSSGSFGSIIATLIYFIVAGGVIIWQISRKI
jgi:hypothetical protein